MPKVLSIHHLPEMFYPSWIFTYQKLGNIFHSPNDRTGVPFQSGLSPAEKPRLIRYDLNKDPVTHSGMANNGFNRLNFHIRKTFNHLIHIDNRPRDAMVELYLTFYRSSF